MVALVRIAVAITPEPCGGSAAAQPCSPFQAPYPHPGLNQNLGRYASGFRPGAPPHPLKSMEGKQAKGYRPAGTFFATKKAIVQHIRAVRDATPLHAEIHDPVVRWLLHRHPQWDQKSVGMTAIGTAMIKGTPAAPSRKEIAILRGAQEPMDISWTKLVARLQKDGTLKHPSDPQECLEELRIAARQEVESQLVPLRAVGFHLDHAYPLTFEQLLFDWVVETGLRLAQIQVESNDGPVVKRWLRDRQLAAEWRKFHQKNAVLILRTPEEHAAQPRHRVDWSAYL